MAENSDQRLGVIQRHLVPDNGAGDASGEGVSVRQEQTASMASGIWEHVPQAPPDPILGITEKYKADPNAKKVNLGVGAYRTEEGEPLVLEVVKKAELNIVLNPNIKKEYLPVGGNPDFCRLSRELAFGKSSFKIQQGAIATVQCLSGTGSLRVGGEFLARYYPIKQLYLPTPTWANHSAIFGDAGLEIKYYRYYHSGTKNLDFQGLVQDLKGAEPGAIVVLHACAHNPTGVDLTPQQWDEILRVCKSRRHLPFFDSAYQGFASGDLDEDALAIRLFADSNVPMLLAQSFSKNMGLYGERAGALSVVCQTSDEAQRVGSQLKAVIRPMYSSPPCHGAAIVSTILESPDLYEEWKVELSGMAGRIKSMRKLLNEALVRKGTPGDWSHILNQIGMFTFTGLTKKQVEYMTREWHIYMASNGRISMAGLSTKTCEHLASAIDDAVRTQS